MARLILDDEIGERDDDFDYKHRPDQRGPCAVPLVPGEGKEQKAVQKFPCCMEREFGGGRSLTGKLFVDFVVP